MNSCDIDVLKLIILPVDRDKSMSYKLFNILRNEHDVNIWYFNEYNFIQVVGAFEANITTVANKIIGYHKDGTLYK